MASMQELQLEMTRPFIYSDGTVIGPRNALSLTGLPDDVLSLKFEVTHEIIDVLQWVNDTLHGGNQKGTGLLLSGDFGRGKTTAALIAAIAFYNSGRSVNYLRTRLLVRLVSERISLQQGMADDDTYDQWYQINQRMNKMHGLGGHVEAYDLLILDDLGKENATVNARHEIDDIVRSRRELNKPTILTTNIDANDEEAFDSRYVEGFYSFLVGNFDIIEFGGEDRRKANRGR